jgi:ppGpp synthetase/RelA/SpoT-type nucleotidyltranferase
MPWAEPKHDRSEVDAAGDVLLKQEATLAELEHAYTVINNWRSSHAFPLNTFQMTLRYKARPLDSTALVAQRVKRLSSIEAKLARLRRLKLSDVQDIAGCRVVLSSVDTVEELVNAYHNSSLKHELDHKDDYILRPKNSGYRGIHLIYRYRSDKKDTYNNLKVEMQFRSVRQHAWATAVETVGTFTRQSLKSSQGEKEWLRFFALMGTAMALSERRPTVPRTPTNEAELIAELEDHVLKLDVANRLRAYGATLRTLETSVTKDTHYFLLVLDPTAQTVSVTGYRSGQLEVASEQYLAAERSIAEAQGSDAVLVSVESIAALKRAYPNYFLDTRLFLEEVRRFVPRKAGRRALVPASR